jgi:hypothetical protein
MTTVLFVCRQNAGQPIEQVRGIRDEIDRRVADLINNL